MHPVDTILDENGKTPLTDLAFQQLHLIFATFTSPQSKTRMQKGLTLAFNHDREAYCRCNWRTWPPLHLHC